MIRFRGIRLFLASSLVLLTASAHAGVRVGGLRGFWAIEADLKLKLFDFDSSFELLPYLLDEYGLSELLGSYQSSRGIQVFSNDTPTALNVALYQTLLNQFAQDLGRACERGQVQIQPPKSEVIAFRPAFATSFRVSCESLMTGTNLDAGLLTLWESVMGFGAESEFEPWRDFVKSGMSSWSTPSERFAQATLAIFMHPYFLLER